MTPLRWQRLKQIFEAALALPVEQASVYLDDACDGDASLRAEARALLAAHHEAGSFIERSPLAGLPEALLAETRVGSSLPQFEASAPVSIEGYRLLHRIGEGGMGVVYEAEQERPRRRVALKVIRGGASTDPYRVRLFEREVAALARLRHPGIAAIYHAGQTQAGEPFFAMELVHGSTLAQAARGGGDAGTGLGDLRGRLRLFVKICEAVNYAHQRGVVHRDLKPANILVAPAADSAGASPLPEVKILDFGLARVSDAEPGASVLTQVGLIQGTLAYMSPEQASGRSDEIDLRTDVYSLGVILYELVIGLPLHDLAGRAAAEALRVVCQDPPPALRGRHGVDRDLETIIHKALEKEPDRRYQSALALAEDLERYLAGEAILARAPSGAYLLSRLVRRHRVAFGFMAALFVLTTTAAVFMTLARNRAAAAEAQARREAARATAIKDFLKGILASGDPRRKGRDARVLDVLAAAGRDLDAGLSGEPEVEAALRDTLSEAYYALGEFDDARQQAEASARLHERLYGRDHLATLKSLDNLAGATSGRGDFRATEPLMRELIERKARLFGSNHLETLRSQLNLTEVLLGTNRNAEAETLCRAIVAAQPTNPAADAVTRVALSNLGIALRRQAKHEEAEAVLRQVVELAIQAGSERDPDTLAFMTNLVGVLSVRGKLAEAAPLARKTLALKREVLGPSHAETVISQSSLGLLLCRERKAEGPETLRDLVTIVKAPGFESRNPPELYDARLGECYRQMGRLPEAERELVSSYRGLEQKLGKGDARTRDVALSLALLYESRSKPGPAAEWRARSQ